MTHRTAIPALLFIFGAMMHGQALTAPIRQLAFYEVTPVHGKSTPDGRLPKAVWETIPVSRESYVYWKVEPLPGVLRTGLQMAYDDDGIHVRITNYEDDMANIRATISKRGNPHLWKDDCVELYFDPQATGVGFMAFTINSLGARLDRKQQDVAVSVPEWRGDNWQVWPSKTDDAWVIEAFFPFSDLGKVAEAGAIWMFNMTRYAYSSGKFVGTTWSPGGNYITPGRFGYLFFGDGTGRGTESLARTLRKYVTPPWTVAVGDRIVLSEIGEPVQVLPPEAAGVSAKKKTEALLARLEPYGQEGNVAGQLAAMRKIIATISFHTAGEALDGIRKLSLVGNRAENLYWKEKTLALIAGQIEQPLPNDTQ